MKNTSEVDDILNEIKMNKAQSKDGCGHFLKSESKTILGEFDGEQMKADDGRTFSVPNNYASKSRLVAGDKLKLIITGDGEFIFKQIGPAPRKRFIGNVEINDEGEFCVSNPKDGKIYRVLLATATYYKLKPKDQAVLIIPMNGNCEWGAVENVISNVKNYAN